jgi:Pentapeptide repeats (9 copies)
MEEFKCKEEAWTRGFCIFHDEKYLQDKDNFEEHKQEVTKRLMDKVTNSTTHNEALFCIGYYLPFIEIEANFTKPVYFFNAIVQGANFRGAKFSAPASFNLAEFSAPASFNLAEFSAPASFNSAKFSGEANFYSAKFSAPASFNLAEFSAPANFYSAEFSAPASFNSAKFSGEANFSSAKFSAPAYFSSAKFSGEANFYSAKFSEESRFSSAKFSGEANFYSAEFSAPASFNLAEFSAPASFNLAEFSAPASFNSAKFSGEANFYSAKFSREANFSSAKFSAPASFNSAKFSREANFVSTMFSALANFNSAEFSREANFISTMFSALANFNSAEFSEEARFYSAKFSGEASFNSAKFSREANFSSAKFSAPANFNLAEFSAPASFNSAKFSEEARFYSAKFSGEANFNSAKFSGEANFKSEFKDMAYFSYVLFEDGKKILFEAEDLSRVSFMNTDITRVRFSDRARWGTLKDKFKVIEEEMLEEDVRKKSPQRVSLGTVMAVYRNLRENYEYRLRYDEAGEFFIKEMELKRKYREENADENEKNALGNTTGSKVVRNGWPRRNLSLTGLYYHLSRYGENLLRPTLVGVAIVFGSTLFWLIQNNPTGEPYLPFITTHQLHNHKAVSNFITVAQIWNNTHSLKAFERSLIDFIPLLPSGSDVKMGLIDYVIKIVGGAVTFGLIAIALRRKFERKYTR